MSTNRPALAAPLRAPTFGRRARSLVLDATPTSSTWRDDARLFGFTFLSGFLFVSVYLA